MIFLGCFKISKRQRERERWIATIHNTSKMEKYIQPSVSNKIEKVKVSFFFPCFFVLIYNQML